MRLATFCLLAALPASAVLAQGSLTPPGAPAPTQKSLDQIEARTPISSLPISISTPGSYYLTGNLSVTTGNGITIAADQVTLDLNGFAISSSANPASGTAILFSGVRRNVTIRNGFIRSGTTFAAGVFTGLGFADGIQSSVATAANLRIADLGVHGVAGDGINLSSVVVSTLVVERCSVSVCSGFGIQAGQVVECRVDTVGNTGIAADSVMNCNAETVNTAVASAAGINAASNVHNSRGVSVSGSGMVGINVTNSRGLSTSGAGISCTNAQNCEGTSTSGSAGINASSGTVSFSRGRRDGGNAIICTNAIGCTVTGTGVVSATNKSLGTP
ncbi:MAG: hypothetical protein JSR82_19810 [Verrucomicrobia bacterium]|nr:hypothetical protein [Verrucomicrobiota bacterium]